MNKPKVIQEVRNEEFNESIGSLKDKISLHHLELDQVSDEIRTLESVLKKSGLDMHKYACPTSQFRECLIFENKRIMYKAEDVEIKPLIEQKAKYRLRVRKYLPGFMRSIL